MPTMPPFMRTRLILMAVAPSLVWLAWIVAQLAFGIRYSVRVAVAFCGGYVVLLGVHTLLAIRWRRRFRQRLETAGGRMCFRCGYDLAALEADSGVCPECGEAFVVEALRHRWRAAGLLGRRAGDDPEGATSSPSAPHPPRR